MGWILELAETLKTPSGWIVVVGAVYALYRWVFAPNPGDEPN